MHKLISAVLLSVFLSVGSVLGLIKVHQDQVAEHTVLVEEFEQSEFQRMWDSVRPISMKGDTGAFCSGVMIDETTMLTAAHCDWGNSEVTVDGKRAVILKKDVNKDLMLVYTRAGCPCVPTVLSPKEGETVYAVGYPLDVGKVRTKGEAQFVNDKGEQLFTAPVTWGNSGGGVFVMRPTGVHLVAIVSRGTVVGMGFFPVFIPHLNYGPGYNSIVSFIIED